MRFYIEGHEVEIDDPSFFKEEVQEEKKQTLEEMLEEYVNLQMAK